MFPPREDILRLAPEIVLSVFGILLMLVEPFLHRFRRGVFVTLATLGAALALAATFYPATHPGSAFSGLLRIDGFSVFVHVIVELVTLLVVLASGDYLEREHIQHGEYYALVLFATVGMGVMASAGELVTAFIGLEVSSISTYILASYRRDSPRSNEAAMKYFLLGSFATAFFLYGVALVFGATGTTELIGISQAPEASSLLKLGMALLLVGLGFKVAAAPFQLWAPDVYEGAPTPLTALMACGPKAAAFALLLRILATVAMAGSFWFWALWLSAILTMFAGNLAALAQSSVKRMLAYSSIAHAGYILVALAAAAAAQTDESALAIAAVLYYLAVYALMKLGAFLLLSQLGGDSDRHVDLQDFYGLASRRPVAAACFSLFLLSLLGLPVTAGFLGKFYIFDAALASHLIWLAVLVAINSVIAAFYYLRVIVAMYMREPQETWTPARMSWALTIVLLIAAAGTFYLGLFPGRVMDFATRAAISLPLH